jgi:hypothetical protein
MPGWTDDSIRGYTYFDSDSGLQALIDGQYYAYREHGYVDGIEQRMWGPADVSLAGLIMSFPAADSATSMMAYQLIGVERKAVLPGSDTRSPQAGRSRSACWHTRTSGRSTSNCASTGTRTAPLPTPWLRRSCVSTSCGARGDPVRRRYRVPAVPTNCVTPLLSRTTVTPTGLSGRAASPTRRPSSP